MNGDLSNGWCEILRFAAAKCGEDYVIHAQITHRDSADGLTFDDFLLGCTDWTRFTPGKWNAQHTFHRDASLPDAVRAISTVDPSDVRVTLLSNDLIYAFAFRLRNEIPTIQIDLSSAIFGKGTFYDYCVIARRGKEWSMFSKFPRGSVYNRFCSTLVDCLEKLFEAETELPHPYQYMIDRYRQVYDDATREQRIFL